MSLAYSSYLASKHLLEQNLPTQNNEIITLLIQTDLLQLTSYRIEQLNHLIL